MLASWLEVRGQPSKVSSYESLRQSTNERGYSSPNVTLLPTLCAIMEEMRVQNRRQSRLAQCRSLAGLTDLGGVTRI
jgi:hypothetical protein